MIIIAHRGNQFGPNQKLENKPSYITSALNKGYDVEIDVWYYDEKWWLGHDKPQYKISLKWIEERKHNLWIHCKNIESLDLFAKKDSIVGVSSLNYFWHQNDDYTLTSHGFIWTYPNKRLTERCIAVLPENTQYKIQDFKKCCGICSDFIDNYQKQL